MLFVFCGISFAAYTGSGRYTEIAATLLIYLIVTLPVATSEEPEVQTEATQTRRTGGDILTDTSIS